MAIPHAVPGQVVDVHPLGARLTAQKSIALFKSQDLEVMRLVLPAGKSLPPHRVRGEITIQCLEGAISVSAEGADHVLRAGQMLYILRNALHGVLALEDASMLLTIALVG
jgi:quercetin dioxygenase-like cupin family protein